MPKHTSSNCILVIESPWELDGQDSNRSSVVPFIEGIAKLHGDTDVYFLNFYDKSSFKTALDCLCKQTFANTIVYVAAHGSSTHIAKVPLKDILSAVSEKSAKFNIRGLMLGSCFAGGKTQLLQNFTQGSGLRWCAGYASSCYWLTGTMIDCAIISSALRMHEEHYQDRESMNHAFAKALAPFAPNAIIGNGKKHDDVPLCESLQFVIQPEGKGHRPLLAAEEIFAQAHSLRAETEEEAY
jgi:hypothetical protein